MRMTMRTEERLEIAKAKENLWRKFREGHGEMKKEEEEAWGTLRDKILELEEGGAAVDLRRNDGNTALSFATNRNHTEVVRLLLDHGADATNENDKGEGVLMYAAEAGNVEATQMLLDRGARSDQRGGIGAWTPLMWAAQNGHEEVARLLMTSGSRPDSRSCKHF